MINVSELKAAWVRKELTQEEVAQKLGISSKTLAAKIKNSKLGVDDACKLIKILEIKNPQEIFFAN